MISILSDFFKGEVDAPYLILYIGAMSFVVFCSLSLHEFAHAFTAVKLGDNTPMLRGRVTINPKAHISPIGALMIFLVGFGYAKPVEVRIRNFEKPKRDMALVALAGPVANLLQAFVCMFIFNAMTAKIPVMSEMMQYVALFFYFVATSNVSLAVFNLLPVPPLDGSRLLNAFLPAKYYFKIMQYERQISLVVIFLVISGVLSVPLGIVNSILMNLITFLTSLPF